MVAATRAATLERAWLENIDFDVEIDGVSHLEEKIGEKRTGRAAPNDRHA
jgi:hypothetical protein